MDSALLAFLESGRACTLVEFHGAQHARAHLFRAVQVLSERYDVLVPMDLTRTAIPTGFDAARRGGGQALRHHAAAPERLCSPFYLTTHPVRTMLSSSARGGLPAAMQMIGRWRR